MTFQPLSGAVSSTVPPVLHQESASLTGFRPECPGLAKVPMGGPHGLWNWECSASLWLESAWGYFKEKTVHKRPKTSSHEDIPLPFTYFILTLSKVAPLNLAAAAISEKVASRAYLST